MGSSSRARPALRSYQRKRDFSRTPEPEGRTAARSSGNLYVIQKHAARALHYDFRLEIDGVLKSWAVPKGPSLDPADKRLAMETEDHPVAYGDFEGIIPKGQYGGGTVLLWDRGTWSAGTDAIEGYRKGAFKFELHGDKLQGGWALFRIRGREKRADARTWLLVKEKDRFARPGEGARLLEERAESVSTGRDLDAIAAAKSAVWESNRTPSASEGPRRARLKAADVPEARKARMPRIGSAQQPTLVTSPPSGDTWLHEMKFDGYRVLARASGKNVRLLSRNGSDWTKRLSGVARGVASLGADVVLDGEVAVLRADGTTSFQDLQAALGEGDEGIVYFVFDLLYWDGYDLTRAPLEARKEALAALLEGATRKSASILRYSQHVLGRGEDFFRNACGMSLEGVVSKRRDAPYEPGRSRTWLKVKCVKEQEVVVGGYTEPSGSRTGIGALLVGVHEGDRLRYAGKVGTGYTRKILEDLRRRLGALERAQSPFDGRIPGAAKAHWVSPRLVAQVRFSEWTRDGRLRHPSFEGLRLDKKPAEVVREVPRPTKAVAEDAPEKAEAAVASSGPRKSRRAAAASSGPRKIARRRPIAPVRAARSQQAEAQVGGVRITHPSRVIDPASGLTKEDIARYYEAVADRILPHLKDRPLTLVRCPEGVGTTCFYSKHAGRVSVSPALRRVKIREKTKTDEYLIADTKEALLGLVQMGVLEIHTWNARYEELEAPDRIVLDLDPGPGVSWARVIEAALELREALSEHGLTSFLKTTGGKGLHIVAPLAPSPRAGWDACFAFARDLAQEAARKSPRAYVTVLSKAEREDRILIDYLRNNRGATSVAAYSTRARANVPVSAPVGWEELGPRLKPDAFTVKNLARRLASVRRDPWAGYDGVRQGLPVERKRSAR
jgi:bifunctional non-homologous end joining protein LigD